MFVVVAVDILDGVLVTVDCSVLVLARVLFVVKDDSELVVCRAVVRLELD